MTPKALGQLEKIGNQATAAKREDVALLCGSTEVYLNSMANCEAYHSAFAATLDALGRRASLVRD